MPDNDTLFVLGSLFAVFSVPSLISAFTHGHAPRMGLILFVAGGALISWAIINQPGGYSFDNLPDVFRNVFAKMTR